MTRTASRGSGWRRRPAARRRCRRHRSRPLRRRLSRPRRSAPAPHLTDYLKVLHKRRWTAATAFLVVLASVTVYTFTATPIFEARTRLLIEAENPNVISFKEVIDEDQAKADYYQTQYNILQSRALARKTIESLGLWEHPLLNRAAGAGKGFSAGRDRRRFRPGHRVVLVGPCRGRRSLRWRGNRGTVPRDRRTPGEPRP